MRFLNILGFCLCFCLGLGGLSCAKGTQTLARTGDTAGASAAGSGGSDASAGSGVSGYGYGGPDASDDDSGSLPAADGGIGPGCARSHYTATLKALDMLILLDQSGSMTEDDDRWTPTTKAIKKFVASPDVAGMGVGLQYFPLGKDDDEKCQADTYAELAVPMKPLPGNAKPLADSIDAHYFTKDECCDTVVHDGTPTRPAMEGVVASLQDWLADHEDRSGVILLATDGEPSPVCDDNGIDDTSKVIEAAAKKHIPTYVVGIGHTDKLDQLAQAGGTGTKALIVDGTGVDTEDELLDALAKVRGEALPCDFALPQGESVDPFNVNVQRSIKDTHQTLINVGSKSDCAKAGKPAWYYDDPKAPTRINLCPDTCDDIASDAASSVQIVVGCATVVL